jgi:hypothetical protein
VYLDDVDNGGSRTVRADFTSTTRADRSTVDPIACRDATTGHDTCGAFSFYFWSYGSHRATGRRARE